MLFGTVALAASGSVASDVAVIRGPVRVEPESLIIEQKCSAAATSAPLVFRGQSAGVRTDQSISISSPFHLQSQGSDGAGINLQVGEDALAGLRARSHVIIRDFLLTPVRSVTLDLHRIECFSDQTIFAAGTADGDKPLPPPDAVLLAGSVQEVRGSAVFLSMSHAGTSGYVKLGDTTYVLSSGPPTRWPGGSATTLVSELSSLNQGGGMASSCGVSGIPELPHRLAASVGSETSADSRGMRVCNVAIDCDYEYFLMMGRDESVALNYVATLIAAVSSLYERDVNVALKLSYVRVWTVEDPYQTCGWDNPALFQNLFKPAGLRPHLAYKFSGCGGAGRALGTLMCPSSPAWVMPVAVSRVQGYFPFPLASSDSTWDVYSVAHEIGHIFGSQHTHCYDPPLDHCSNAEGICYSGPVICTRGSIMSYCNQCGGMSNIDLEFPLIVAARMEPFIENACMELAGGSLYVHNGGATTLQIDSIVSSVPWMTVTKSTFLIASQDSQPIPVVADWEAFTQPQQTGRLSIFSSEAQSTFTMPVVANRAKPFARFASSPLSGCAPLGLQLTDQSAGSPTNWLWSFGDDSTSRLQNPVHIYTEPGIYTLRMESANACGTDQAPDTAIIVVSGPACHFESPVIVNQNDSLIRSYDLWRSIGSMTSPPGTLTFVIDSISQIKCGARIDDNRFLSLAPVPGWEGNSVVRVRTTDSRGCSCVAKIDVVINERPTIQMDMPQSTVVTNHQAVITWIDSDVNDDARIMLYRSPNADCSDPIAITGKPLSEDDDGHAGYYEWNVQSVPDGRYFIHAVISDQISSAESCSRGMVVVDLTPPVTTINMTCAALDSNGWCRSEGLVELSASDNVSGVARTTYRVNHGSWTRYTRPFRVKAQGPSLIEYFSTDVAGNPEAMHVASQPYRIDTRAPYISRFAQDNNLFVDGDYMSSTPSFSFQLRDDGSRIDLATILIKIEPGTSSGPVVIRHGSAEFSYDSLTWAARVTVLTPLIPGHQTLTVSAADRVGNIASATTKFQVGGKLQFEDMVFFPNPTPGPAQFTFKLSQDADVSIRIYDLSGNLVRKIPVVACKAGYNAVPWDGWSDRYGLLASGAYVYEVTARNEQGSVRHLDKLAVLR